MNQPPPTTPPPPPLSLQDLPPSVGSFCSVGKQPLVDSIKQFLRKDSVIAKFDETLRLHSVKNNSNLKVFVDFKLDSIRDAMDSGNPSSLDQWTRALRLDTNFSFLDGDSCPGPPSSPKDDYIMLRALRSENWAVQNYSAGLQNENSGNLDAALRNYTIAVEAHPKFAPPWVARAKLRLKRDLNIEALDDIRKALLLIPGDENVIDLRVLILQRLSITTSEEEEFMESLRIKLSLTTPVPVLNAPSRVPSYPVDSFNYPCGLENIFCPSVYDLFPFNELQKEIIVPNESEISLSFPIKGIPQLNTINSTKSEDLLNSQQLTMSHVSKITTPRSKRSSSVNNPLSLPLKPPVNAVTRPRALRSTSKTHVPRKNRCSTFGFTAPILNSTVVSSSQIPSSQNSKTAYESTLVKSSQKSLRVGRYMRKQIDREISLDSNGHSSLRGSSIGLVCKSNYPINDNTEEVHNLNNFQAQIEDISKDNLGECLNQSSLGEYESKNILSDASKILPIVQNILIHLMTPDKAQFILSNSNPDCLLRINQNEELNCMNCHNNKQNRELKCIKCNSNLISSNRKATEFSPTIKRRQIESISNSDSEKNQKAFEEKTSPLEIQNLNFEILSEKKNLLVCQQGNMLPPNPLGKKSLIAEKDQIEEVGHKPIKKAMLNNSALLVESIAVDSKHVTEDDKFANNESSCTVVPIDLANVIESGNKLSHEKSKIILSGSGHYPFDIIDSANTNNLLRKRAHTKEIPPWEASETSLKKLRPSLESSTLSSNRLSSNTLQEDGSQQLNIESKNPWDAAPSFNLKDSKLNQQSQPIPNQYNSQLPTPPPSKHFNLPNNRINHNIESKSNHLMKKTSPWVGSKNSLSVGNSRCCLGEVPSSLPPRPPIPGIISPLLPLQSSVGKKMAMAVPTHYQDKSRSGINHINHQTRLTCGVNSQKTPQAVSNLYNGRHLPYTAQRHSVGETIQPPNQHLATLTMQTPHISQYTYKNPSLLKNQFGSIQYQPKRQLPYRPVTTNNFGNSILSTEASASNLGKYFPPYQTENNATNALIQHSLRNGNPQILSRHEPLTYSLPPPAFQQNTLFNSYKQPQNNIPQYQQHAPQANQSQNLYNSSYPKIPGMFQSNANLTTDLPNDEQQYYAMWYYMSQQQKLQQQAPNHPPMNDTVLPVQQSYGYPQGSIPQAWRNDPFIDCSTNLAAARNSRVAPNVNKALNLYSNTNLNYSDGQKKKLSSEEDHSAAWKKHKIKNPTDSLKVAGVRDLKNQSSVSSTSSLPVPAILPTPVPKIAPLKQFLQQQRSKGNISQ